MNNLSTLLHSIGRLAGAQTSKAAPDGAGDSAKFAVAEGFSSFGSLLHDFSEKQANSGQSRFSDVTLAFQFTAADTLGGGIQQTELLQSFGKDSTLDPNHEELFEAEGLSSKEQLPVAPLVGALPMVGTIRAVSPEGKGSRSASQILLMDVIRLPTDDSKVEELAQLPNHPTMKASVIHQEGHFKPVTAASEKNFFNLQHSQAQDEVMQMEDPTKHPSAQFGGSGAHDESLDGREQNLAAVKAAVVPAKDKVDGVNSTATYILQRVAEAVLAEAKELSGAGRPEAVKAKTDVFSPTFRGPEGVIRILNVEIHPAELGPVTVKMRLSGDRLEMELQARSVETAELLKRDSEKLSSLLRTAGYKPDVLTILLIGNEAQQQDASLAQRQQSFSQSHSQFGGYQQGDGGSDGRFGRPPERTESRETRRMEEGDEMASVGPGSRNIYL